MKNPDESSFFSEHGCLTDSFGRIHDYLRISVTQSCNFRCAYCIPNTNPCPPPAGNSMSAAEIYEISKTFCALGIKKIRLTGGEPLLRKDFPELLDKLGALPVQLAVTTNGVLMDRFIDCFLKANLLSVNVSLDSLKPERFFEITGENFFNKVLSNIHLLLHHGFHVKVNTVLMSNMNKDEISDFIDLTLDYPVHVRFIEYMPFAGNNWDYWKVVGLNEILESIKRKYKVVKLDEPKNSTAKKFQVKGHKGTFAVISTVTKPFCSDCNRLRLTVDGKMRNCLFATMETDLLNALRQGKDIRPLIIAGLRDKKKERGGHTEMSALLNNRKMVEIGG
ncbi:MAG: GTP 3',8-cyclase MoaA [Bacteroidetes bacterium]|nr:GTP 3',8-cyclase MoaA [Bacteroidota bacterium]